MFIDFPFICILFVLPVLVSGSHVIQLIAFTYHFSSKTYYSKCFHLICSTGRGDYRNSGNRDEHPSGVPRPYVGGRGGRGRGRGSYSNSSRGHNSNSERQDSGYGATRWGSAAKDGDDDLRNFPGAKVQNSPGREAFPGGWDGSAGDGSGWGGGASTSDNNGWGQRSGGAGASEAEHVSSGWEPAPKKAADNGWSRKSGAGSGW